jgi:transketolase
MAHVSDEKIYVLEKKANEIRQTVIEMLAEAGSGHTAGPLGMADIFAAFYFHILKHNPSDPLWSERDRLVLSNGHIAPVLYAALAHAGYFPHEETKTLRKLGSRLQGHPEKEKLPGIETTSGPLGSGLSQASGMAYVAKMDKSSFRTYCLMSDGELQAGNTWEALMFAGANKLGNLTAVIDRNNIQISGYTEDIMQLEPLKNKFEAFNWHVIDVDGHNIEEFINAVEMSKAVYERPTVIIAHTISGKGIKSMEFDYLWHGKPPTPEEAQEFLAELRNDSINH